MLSKSLAVSTRIASIANSSRCRVVQSYFSTASREVEGTSSAGRGPIGIDGKHEVWREGQSSDHDNEPRYGEMYMCAIRPFRVTAYSQLSLFYLLWIYK